MSFDNVVSQHYTHGNLLKSIEAALELLGKSVDAVTIEDLGPVDEFHIGGRIATESFMDQLNFSQRDHVLDVGCGLGGASRFMAKRFNNQVTGIDLTPEYIETGNALCAWVRLDKQITLHHGSALSMPFEAESFDGAFMMHVGMNIEDKHRLFDEVYRVLRPGAVFGVYDVMQVNDGELNYPVPWATESHTSKLATPEQYLQGLVDTGFEVSKENNRREFALEFFKKLQEKTQANGGPPPLGLHTIMKETTAPKIKNMIDNIAEGLIAPVEIIARKP